MDEIWMGFWPPSFPPPHLFNYDNRPDTLLPSLPYFTETSFPLPRCTSFELAGTRVQG
jgi:hypothetical protein